MHLVCDIIGNHMILSILKSGTFVIQFYVVNIKVGRGPLNQSTKISRFISDRSKRFLFFTQGMQNGSGLLVRGIFLQERQAGRKA